jgi:hypothetical protein
MRSKRLAAAVVVAAALAAVPVATAGMMHPTLGAQLSGMGQTGAVDFQAHAKGHRLCWTFHLHLMHVLGATVRDKGGMVVARLGHMYRAQGCAMLSKSSLALIETKPGHYSVWVATKGHPGELRGKLHAGMAHT